MGELQRALQTATTRMLSSETSPGTPHAAAQFAATAALEPVQVQASSRQAASRFGGSLFEGLSVGDKPSIGIHQNQPGAVLPPATATSSQLTTFTPPKPKPATLSLSPVPAQSGKNTQQGAGSAGGIFSGLDLVPEGSSADAFASPAALLNRSYSAASSDTTALEASGMRGGHMSTERSQLVSAAGALSTAGSITDPLCELLPPPISPHEGTPPLPDFSYPSVGWQLKPCLMTSQAVPTHMQGGRWNPVARRAALESRTVHLCSLLIGALAMQTHPQVLVSSASAARVFG